MPVTQTKSSSPSTPLSTGNVLLVSGLALFLLVTFACFAIRRRETRNTRQAHPPHSQWRNKPSHHDVQLAASVTTSTWRTIQPLAVQTPFWERRRQKYRASHSSPNNKRHPAAGSYAAIDSGTLLEEPQIFSATNSDRHLHITVLIAMPLPPEDGRSVRPSHDVAVAETNMAIGIADAVFPAPQTLPLPRCISTLYSLHSQ
ncbi:hypothetical protein C8F04DRAFT_1174158 [Mycena alexandri]|uniref:Uncharacterized protein n=1 Tax=Mycena alexandri TaxID=1745969 RepID=A0AAD6XEP1_9AGAR|nr:hypothetical protein C8F04DRAFT_1174158 [Mycena alexandri]